MLNVALIDWVIGELPTDLTAEILHFEPGQVALVVVNIKDDRPIEFALVPGGTSAPTGRDPVYDYPQPDMNTIRISIPPDWTECVLTFLHGSNATIVACHHAVTPPDVLYNDYKSGLTVHAGYYTILLEDAEDAILAAE